MRKYLKISLVVIVAILATGAGKAFYSSVDGTLSPGVVRAYPATIDEIYTDGTVSARLAVWSGIETPVRLRISGIVPTDTRGFISILSGRVVGQGQVFVQTAEQFDGSGILFGTVFYNTRNGFRDVAMDALDARVATPATNANVRVISQGNFRDVPVSSPRRQSAQQSRPSCGSEGKVDGKRIAFDILGSLLNKNR